MLESLATRIHCYGDFGEILDGDLAEYIAKMALDFVEEKGMAPPKIETDLYDRANACNYMSHEWEDENEDNS